MVERSSCAALLGMELRRFICTQCRMPNCFVQYLSCFSFYSKAFKTDQIMLRTTDTGNKVQFFRSRSVLTTTAC